MVSANSNAGMAARPVLDRESIERRVSDLFEYYEQTRPDGDDPKAEGKDARAASAILVAQILFRDLAGWALCHEAGKVLEGHYRESGERFDSHEFETIGEQFWAWRNGGYELDTIRLVIAQIVNSLQFLFPNFTGFSLCWDLEALNWGDAANILKPNKTGMSTTSDMVRNRLGALKYVYYLKGKGFRVGIAKERVATAYNISVHTLSSWQTRQLPELLGKERLKSELERARSAGDYARRVEDEGLSEEFLPDLNEEESLTDLEGREEYVWMKMQKLGFLAAEYQVMLANRSPGNHKNHQPKD